MAESKRAFRKPSKARAGGETGRLTMLSLVGNAVAAFVGGPALLVVAYLLFTNYFGPDVQNQNLFLGAVCVMIAIFLFLLSGLKVREHITARRRFDDLLDGDRKSAIMQNLEELSRLARSLGPEHRRRLEARLDELGVKR